MARLTIGKTDTAIRGKITPGRYSAGDGLYLQVRHAKPERTRDGTLIPRFSKTWIFRYRFGRTKTGKPAEREMGLGSCPDVGLSSARDKAGEYRRLLVN